MIGSLSDARSRKCRSAAERFFMCTKNITPPTNMRPIHQPCVCTNLERSTTARVNAGRSAPKPLNSASNCGITKSSRIKVTTTATASTAADDVVLDLADQLLHRLLLVADADDLEGLDQRNARGEHGRELTAEERDVPGRDLAAAAEHRTLLAELGRDDVLPPQVRARGLFVHREDLPADLVAPLVLAYPGEWRVLGGSNGGRRHGDYRPLA